MSFNLGSSGRTARASAHHPKPAGQREPARADAGHLRIRELARQIDAADHPASALARGQTGQLRKSYELSLKNIDDNIYALAAATAALDQVGGKLLEARIQIEALGRRGQAVDVAKIERTLMAMADHIDRSVRRADEHSVNMLRDAGVQIRLSEAGGRDERAMQVDLVLISIDKIMAWRLREGPSDPAGWIELIDEMNRVVNQNVQILSSLILTLFAARDYSSEMVGLVIDPMTDQTWIDRPQMPAPPVAPPSRLMAFLKEVTYQG